MNVRLSVLPAILVFSFAALGADVPPLPAAGTKAPAFTLSSQDGSEVSLDGTEYAARNTFLIDPTGTIRKVYPKVKPAGHTEEVLADLASLQADQ